MWSQYMTLYYALIYTLYPDTRAGRMILVQMLIVQYIQNFTKIDIICEHIHNPVPFHSYNGNECVSHGNGYRRFHQCRDRSLSCSSLRRRCHRSPRCGLPLRRPGSDRLTGYRLHRPPAVALPGDHRSSGVCVFAPGVTRSALRTGVAHDLPAPGRGIAGKQQKEAATCPKDPTAGRFTSVW